MNDGEEADVLKAVAEIRRRSLEAERAALESIERRSSTVVTTTGGLVTVLGVVTAFVPEDRRSTSLSNVSLTLILLALAFFFAAVVLAQASNLMPQTTGKSELERMLARQAEELTLGLWAVNHEIPAGEALRLQIENDSKLLLSYKFLTQPEQDF
ncbi:hypothetical protein [Geodermatophilus sabuli]|uniref:hypothetical protein n=1 Tax=Geodermatophilus sabuli TaxID=1564158 RepID=UPI001179DE2B|nr:hypothetical protein [Geodermatophilus sabuli]MBB3082312.1 hypothetical protein [Geodermatophilus sabuli]